MVCEMNVHVCVRVWLFFVCGSFIFTFVDSPFHKTQKSKYPRRAPGSLRKNGRELEFSRASRECNKTANRAC